MHYDDDEVLKHVTGASVESTGKTEPCVFWSLRADLDTSREAFRRDVEGEGVYKN